MYKIDRRGGGGGSKNRILGQTQNIRFFKYYLRVSALNLEDNPI